MSLPGQLSLPFDKPATDPGGGRPCEFCGGAMVVKTGAFGPAKEVCTRCDIGRDVPKRPASRGSAAQ